ncbi:MAG: 3-oxoacyl-[acyl-carrier-protein] reductase [Elusimicrobia bacterium CG1_02_37_114]|nr:MAG: 3-oxoacyl-[acyl-carrier-protein] reductase [Elusimicrobia bacterium CG1_02_37_114]PIV53300.1 MAG: beta-ketoacyl-ACP reductase [Elusimicrobia bacterium CG02_land_8_20_14_3_00_37_13]PIZ12834.1 MAG: beta-ketoacyl-ACP reductase [Elusimicrobia bacterium CG_4_10_14_0_8_um_filter_37_32]
MCNKRLLDKVAIVTGGAQGIGRAIANALANEGAKIVISDINESLAKTTAEEIAKTAGIETLSVKTNVANYAEVENLVKQTLDKFSKIDILVNNAGITRDNLLMRMSDEEWSQVIDVNLKGVFNCTKAVSKVMMKQRSGRIVNIASVVGLMGNPGQINYVASKGGVIALTKSAARELASRNILVNAVAPGFIRTAMTDALSDEQKKKLSELIPLQKLGEADDVAKAVVFLCSDESSYITGQVISVNGGMYM